MGERGRTGGGDRRDRGGVAEVTTSPPVPLSLSGEGGLTAGA
jgi:hypothetical protein